ncbi:MAG: TonB family protein [Candidatus Manganitrophus sp.]|nr:MAG: TonB family protein [Candidatus Manganitrophus sp.]
MRDEMTLLDTDKTFRRILTVLLSFYAAVVIFVQVKGESFHLNTLARIAPPQEPPRVARLLVEPQKAPILPAAPPIVEAPKIEPLKLEPPRIEPAKIEKPALPPPSTKPAPGVEQAGPASSTPAPPKAPPQEQVKNIGLLGLLGGNKGSGSASSVGKGFSSLKEIVPPSAEKKPSPSAPAASSPPLPSFAQEEIDKIRQRTLAQQETTLTQTRQAAVQEDLSQAKITQQGGIGGAQNQEAVSGIVQQNRDRLQLIYNKQLLKKPGLQGFLTVEFTITAQGQVIECRVVTSSLSDPLFEREVIQEILRWKFPPTAQGTTTVLYPLSFSPAG